MRTRCQLLFLTTTVWVLLSYVLGQEEYSKDDLTAMTDDDLEQICVSRGFEILRDAVDPSTGLAYALSHDDFVDAAQSCLEIEREMNELLAEYPELAAEVEEEIKKLEAEQQSRQAEVEMLQHELEQTEKAAAESRKSSSGSAFVPSPETGNDSNAPVEDDFEIIHDGDSTGDEETDSKLLEEQEIIPNEVVEKLVSEGAKEESTEIIPKNETTSEEDFTMQALTFEIIRAMVKQVESDVRRIIELMTPVIRPILRAGDVAWRHLRVTFESLRHSYENSRPTNETNVDGLKDKALV